jgi:pyrimidine-specific ribonucleoside hydrolase
VGGILAIGVLWTLTQAESVQHHHGHDDHEHVAFDHFPREAHDFREDLRPLIEPIIEKHGEEEWEIVVLTHEFHRHLGIYSIIGAKMGLRARDYFQVGLDEMTVVSWAGRRPPISCLNDGLQVSTGATLGHGTISVPDNATPAPRAQFTHEGTTITVELKQPYWDAIKKDIHQAVQQYGLQSPAYWRAVRVLGLRYWQQWSRHEIFTCTVTSDHKEHDRP